LTEQFPLPRVKQTGKKISEPHKLRRRRRSSIAADSAARHNFFGGGGVVHFRLAAAAGFGGSGVYRTSPIAPRFSRLWSFTVLRLLNTRLRSTMSHTRLKNVAVCHVNQDLLDACDFDKVIELFISTCESRIKLFGK
jgi:hypothetical protein